MDPSILSQEENGENWKEIQITERGRENEKIK